MLQRVVASAGGADKDPDTDLVPLNRRIAQLLDTHRRHFPWRKIELEIDDQPLLVSGGDFCIEQTVRNFLSNAEKYSPSDTPIDVRVRREGNEATVRVLDRGSGIASGEIQSLFEPFYRSASTASVAGVGIGLTVCKRLVEGHNGRVWAHSRDGGGAEFGFALPLADESAHP
jgi:K+-sensing histidine kinase KdpD